MNFRTEFALSRVSRFWTMAAARISLALCLLSLSSCIIPFAGELRPKLFISDQELSPECLREVMDYMRTISGADGDPAQLEQEVRTIQHIFTTGGAVSVTAQKIGSPRKRELKFYFSRSGGRLSIVIYDGQVESRTGDGSTYVTVGVSNTWLGANVKTLSCRGPFVGQDIDIRKGWSPPTP